MIRPLLTKDVSQVVSLYENYMFDSELKKIGEKFLYLLFVAINDSNYSINYVYEENSKVVGFISAALNTKKLFEELLRKSKLAFLRSLFFSLLKRPYLLFFMLEFGCYLQKAQHKRIKAELLFIVIDPQYRKSGRAKGLINTVVTDLKKMSHNTVRVLVLKKNWAANHLLRNLGFCLVNEFKFFNKQNLLYEYVFNAKAPQP